jgi:hypothetical protein
MAISYCTQTADERKTTHPGQNPRHIQDAIARQRQIRNPIIDGHGVAATGVGRSGGSGSGNKPSMSLGLSDYSRNS